MRAAFTHYCLGSCDHPSLLPSTHRSSAGAPLPAAISHVDARFYAAAVAQAAALHAVLDPAAISRASRPLETALLVCHTLRARVPLGCSCSPAGPHVRLNAILDGRALREARYLSFWPLPPVAEDWWWAHALLAAAETAKRDAAERTVRLLEERLRSRAGLRAAARQRLPSDTGRGDGGDDGGDGPPGAAAAAGSSALPPSPTGTDGAAAEPGGLSTATAEDKALYGIVRCIARWGEIESIRRRAMQLQAQADRSLAEARVAASAVESSLRAALARLAADQQGRLQRVLHSSGH